MPDLTRLELVGGFRLSADGHPLRIKNRKAQAILAYLSLVPGASESRERLAGLLWSESSEEKARASLRQTLHDLRVALDGLSHPIIDFSHAEITLHIEHISVDIRDMVSDGEADRVSPHLFKEKRPADALLLGFEDLDPAFRMWLLVQRQNIQERTVRLLEDKLDRNNIDSISRRQFAEALLNLDPTHEGACQFLMIYFAERGDSVSALRVYKTLWDLLDEEYEIEPSQRTQDLVVQLKMGGIKETVDQIVLPAPVPGALPDSIVASTQRPQSEPTPLLVIVKAFANEGVPAEKLHIVEGFRHELLAALVRFRELAVFEDVEGEGGDQEITANSTSIAIEGRAFAEDGSLYLTLMLRERTERRYLWSTRQKLSVERWYESQQSVIRQLAGILKIQISQERLSRIAKLPPVSTDVFDRWLVGQELQSRWRPEEEKRSQEIFRQIVREAPFFGPAFSSLAQIINARHLVFPGYRRSPELTREALEFATEAVLLDPFDSRAQLCLAWSHALNNDFNSAALNFQLAHELNESDPWTLVSSAQGLAFCGEQADANRLAKDVLQFGFGASQLNWGYLVGLRFLDGDYEGCVTAAQHAKDAIYNLRAWKTAALAQLGRMDEAAQEAKLFVELISQNWFGSGAPTKSAIIAWLLHCFPIRDAEKWEALRDGLAKAGLAARLEDLTAAKQ